MGRTPGCTQQAFLDRRCRPSSAKDPHFVLVFHAACLRCLRAFRDAFWQTKRPAARVWLPDATLPSSPPGLTQARRLRP